MNLRSIVPDRVSKQAKLFLFATILNGLGNGVFNVIGLLYLTSLGFDSAALGSILMMNAMGATLLTIPAGVLADRYGKGKVMLFGFSSMVMAIILLLTAKSIQMFMIAFLLIGVVNAAFVVLGPLYSSFFDKEDMDRAFGLMGVLNILSASIGSLFGFIPPMLVASQGYSLQASYWTVLTVAAGFFVPSVPFYMLSLRGVVEPKRKGGFKFSLRSKGVVAKFSLLSIISGIGGGVFFSLFPYYVNKKFSVESDALGALFFISNFVSAGANAIAPTVSKKLGTLKTIAASIGLCTPIWLVFPLAPNFTWLSALYITRIAIVNISNPLSGSLFMKLLYDEEKATANSIRTVTSQGSSVVAPKLGGQLMKQVSLDFPVYIGSGLYVVLAASYYFLLRSEKEKEAELKPVREKRTNE